MKRFEQSHVILLLLVLLAAALIACKTTGANGIQVTEVKQIEKGTWAKPKEHFGPGEVPALRVFGYGGHEVTLELWEASRGLINKGTSKIPKATARTADDGIRFGEHFGSVQPMRMEKVTWTTTDWIVRFNALRPGIYEVRLTADDGRRATARFRVDDK